MTSTVTTNAKMSIVTSDSNVVREQIRQAQSLNTQQLDVMANLAFGMSRMKWLMALRPLFDSLQAFHCNSKKRHIEKGNFLDALEKVRTTLDLQDPVTYNGSEETSISFESVWQQFSDHLPEHFTWDNLFDVLLFNTVASQFVYDLHAPEEQEEENIIGDVNDSSYNFPMH